MSNTSIQLKKSGQAGNTPSSLTYGEIAINYADGKLYYKDNSGGISFISNQFSFDTINSNNSLILASSISDTLSFVAGNNITINTNTSTKTITINSTASGGSGLDQFARDTANSAGSYANSAFSKANNALANTTGTFNGELSVTGIFKSLNSVGDEGGQIDLAKPATNTTITTGVSIDVYQNKLRIFETGGTNRGVYIDIPSASAGVATDLLNPSATPDTVAREAANSAGIYANGAFTQANAAFITANTADSKAVTSGSYANSAYTQANTATNNAASASLYANAAFIQANAAFDKANTGVANTATTANVAINARITIVNTGIYYPIVTDTTITGSDTFHYSSNDFLMYAANNTFRATGNVWAGQFITVGSNIPVVNSGGYWVGQPLLANTSERSNVSVYTSVGKSEEGIFYPVLVSTTNDDNLNFANSDFIFNATDASFQAAGNVYAGQNMFVSGTQLTSFSSIGSPLAHSYRFNGTNHYLEVSNSTSILIPGTKDFTIEAFIYITSNTTTDCIVSKGYSGTDWRFETNTTGKIIFYNSSSGTLTSANSIPINTWKHVAVSRTGGTLYLFIDGVLENSALNSANLTSTSALRIGRQPSTSTGYFGGHISNLRFLNGTGLYSANFSVPNAPLTSIANTVLLTAQSSTIRDNGPYGFTLLNYGTGGVTSNNIVSPFTSYEVFVDLTPTSNVILKSGKSIQFGDGTTQTTANVDFTNITISSPGTYGNASYIPVITLTANGRINAISTIAAAGGGGGSGTDQFARDTANAAFIQANAAFNAANTGGGGGGSGNTSIDTFTGDGTTNTFALSTSPVSENNTIVNIDGVLQLHASYNISGANIVFSGTPANNAQIEVMTLSITSTGGGATGNTANLVNRTYTGDNTTVTFAVTSGVTNTSLIVTENGIIQEPGVDYYISGANVVFTTAPSTSVKVGIRELALSANTGSSSSGTTVGKAIAMAIVFGG